MILLEPRFSEVLGELEVDFTPASSLHLRISYFPRKSLCFQHNTLLTPDESRCLSPEIRTLPDTTAGPAGVLLFPLSAGSPLPLSRENVGALSDICQTLPKSCVTESEAMILTTLSLCSHHADDKCWVQSTLQLPARSRMIRRVDQQM